MVVLFGVQPPKKQTLPWYNIFPLLPYPEANGMKKVSVGYWFGASSCQMNQCVPWCSTTWHRTEPVRPAIKEHSKCADQTSFVFARNTLIMRCQHAQKNMGPAEHDITTWLAILLLQKDSKNSVWTWNRYHGMRWSHSTIASISHSLKQLQKHKKIKKQEHHLKMWVRWEPTTLYITWQRVWQGVWEHGIHNSSFCSGMATSRRHICRGHGRWSQMLSKIDCNPKAFNKGTAAVSFTFINWFRFGCVALN